MSSVEWNTKEIMNDIDEKYKEINYITDDKKPLTIGELRQLINELGREYDNYYIRCIRESMDLYGRTDFDYYSFNGFFANKDKGVAFVDRE